MEQNNLASKNSSSIPPDPKSKNWLVIGLAILVVILLGLVSFLIYQNCQLRRQFKQQTQLGFPIPTTAISWNTYKNEKFGFEIKYPGNFEVQDYSHVDDWGGKYSPTDRKGNRKSLFVFIPAQGEFEGPWLDKFDFFLSISTDTEKYGIGEQEERFFFGDEDGWRNIIKTQKNLDVLQTGNVSYNIVNNGYHYTLAFSQKYPPEEFLSWTDQIASTFKFLDQSEVGIRTFEVIQRIPEGTESGWVDESKIVKSPLGKVSIIFNHEIDEITLTENNFCVFWGIEDKVPGRIEYNGSTKTASYIFDQKIKSNLRLTVIVKGIKDTKGNQIEELLYNIDVE